MAIYYKQIINSFNAFSTNHALLNSFGYGDISRVDVIEYAQGHFPLMYIHTDRDNLQNSVSNYAFQVLICDKLFDDRSNALDAASTCHQIAIDFISEFRDQFSTYGFELNENSVTINYIEEQYSEWCIGWLMNITVKVPDGLSACSIPNK